MTWAGKLTAVFWLALLALGALANGARAQEEKSLWDRDVERKKNEAAREYLGKYENAHFRVFFDTSTSTKSYAGIIGRALLKSRAIITGTMAYQEPEWLKSRKLDIYVKDLIRLSAAGVSYRPRISDGGSITESPWIEITLESRFREKVGGSPIGALWRSVRATVTHEYFHQIQFGYDRKERGWLIEATAAWIEDKVFPTPEKLWNISGHRARVNSWMSGKPFVSSFEYQEYAASLFFQYLTERRPGGNYRIRKIWEEAAKRPGHSTYRAISKVLGDTVPWGPKTRSLVADFAVAAFIRDPKRNKSYSFRKLKGLAVKAVTEVLLLPGITFPGALTGNTLRPITRSLTPFRIGYYDIRSSAPFSRLWINKYNKALKDGDDHGRLLIEIRGDKRDRWEFRLIVHQTGSPDEWQVLKFPKSRIRGGWNRLIVEKYPKFEVVLVAINFLPSLKDKEICAAEDTYTIGGKTYKRCPMASINPKAEFEIAAAFLKPTVVKSLTVEYPDRFGKYRKVWKIKREEIKDSLGRTIWRTRNTLTEGIRYRPGSGETTIRFLLETSRPVLKSSKFYKAHPGLFTPSPELFIAGKKILLFIEKKDSVGYLHTGGYYRTKFSGTLDARSLGDAIRALESGKKKVVFLPVRINGRDWLGRNFDIKPVTAPKLKIAGKDSFRIDGWEGGAGTPGGTATLGGRKIPFHMRDTAPYLAKITVHQGDKQIYKAEWEADADEKREGRRLLAREVSKPFDPKKSLRLELTFDGPVKDVVVDLGPAGTRLPAGTLRMAAPNSPDGVKSVYQVSFPPSAKLEKFLRKNKRVTIFVSAVSQNGIKLDGDPRSPAWYDYDDKRWYWLEEDKEIIGKGGGGPDRWHTLYAQGRSFLFLLDVSGSMRVQLPRTKQGIVDAIRTLRPGDEVALVVFGGCVNYRLAVPFTDNPEDIVKAIRNLQAGGGTPLAEATQFAKTYMAKAARFPKPKLMVFSDDEKSNCGGDAGPVFAKPVDPKPPPVEDKPEKIKWTAYKFKVIPNRYFPRYRVIEIEYYQEKSKKKNLARLTVRRYPVSTMSSKGRTLWSINWSNRKVTQRRKASGKDVDALKAGAEALRGGAMSRDEIRQAVQKAIGPGAVALTRR